MSERSVFDVVAGQVSGLAGLRLPASHAGNRSVCRVAVQSDT